MIMMQLEGARRLAFPPRSRRAMSLFGVILGVGISAIVVAGLVAAYNGVTGSIRAGNIQSGVITAVTNIRRTYANATTFVGSQPSLNAIIYSSAPSNWQNVNASTSAAGITFPWWDGTAQFVGSDVGLTTDRFALELHGIPDGICSSIFGPFVGDPSVTRMAAIAHGTALTATNGTVVAANGSNVAAACAVGTGTDDTVDILLQFTG